MEELIKIQNEIKEMDKQILEICKENKEIDKQYTGMQIYFSPLVINPTIMFLGINTGAGNLKWTNKRAQRFEPLDEIDYIKYGYRFAIQNSKLFESIGRIDLLKNAFKTNLYYIGTENQKNIKKLFTNLQNITGIDYYNKFHQYIKILIKNIKPQILICEGKYVFNVIKLIYQIENKSIRKVENSHIVVTKLHNIHIVGYNRFSSSIINREILAKELKKLINDVETY